MMPRITVSLCLHLPAGKSCRQNGGFNTRMLPHSSQGTLPFPCSARGRRPSPHLCLEYQCLAVDRGTRNLPRESSAASQLMCPLLLSGRGGPSGQRLCGLGLCCSDCARGVSHRPPPPQCLPLKYLELSPNTSGILRSLGVPLTAFSRYRCPLHCHFLPWGKLL